MKVFGACVSFYLAVGGFMRNSPLNYVFEEGFEFLKGPCGGLCKKLEYFVCLVMGVIETVALYFLVYIGQMLFINQKGSKLNSLLVVLGLQWFPQFFFALTQLVWGLGFSHSPASRAHWNASFKWRYLCTG